MSPLLLLCQYCSCLTQQGLKGLGLSLLGKDGHSYVNVEKC